MKYMLLVHHDEEAFGKFSESKRQQMLEESVELTHQLHAKRQYINACNFISRLHVENILRVVKADSIHIIFNGVRYAGITHHGNAF